MIGDVKFLALEQHELSIMQKLGNVIIANYNGEPVRQPEPTMEENRTLADVFMRIREMVRESEKSKG